MKILGISAFYHDSSAALVIDGQVIAAAQEERFTRKKQDPRFPKNAIQSVLAEKGLSMKEIDLIVFYENPAIKLNRIINSFIAEVPHGLSTFTKAMEAQIFDKKRWVTSLIRQELNYIGEIQYIKHHASHAASAFYPSPFSSAAFLTIDGVGEWETTTYGIGKENKLTFHKRINFPHSLGLLYAAFTYFTGFKVNSGEYKVMGLAPYGEPKYVNKILEEMIDLKDDGSFHLNMKYFDFASSEKMINENFEKLFGRTKREPETLLTQDEMNFARSIQDVTEIIMLKMARHIKKETQEKYLCLAGGVALNCVANGKILRENIFEDIWIQPASGDAGGALGAALYAWHQILENKRVPAANGTTIKNNTFLGPQFSQQDIKDYLEFNKIPHKFIENMEEIASDLLVQGKVIGWFSGRMEFGPRALGARSIIGDARLSEMQKNMNLKIKFRESFRPFAPAVLEEKADQWFDLDRPSPFMLLVSQVKKEKCKPASQQEEKLFGIDKLNCLRSEIPAVTHVDYSARTQTVSKITNAKFHKLIENFEKKTGCPVIINTSFNVRGEPIVCTPDDAYRCFMRTQIDYLVLENFLIKKDEQPPWQENQEWQKEFVLD